MPKVRIDASELDELLENEGSSGLPAEFFNHVDNILSAMKESPGDVNEEITLVIVNDFEEPEDEDEESEDIDGSNTDTKKEA